MNIQVISFIFFRTAYTCMCVSMYKNCALGLIFQINVGFVSPLVYKTGFIFWHIFGIEIYEEIARIVQSLLELTDHSLKCILFNNENG